MENYANYSIDTLRQEHGLEPVGRPALATCPLHVPNTESELEVAIKNANDEGFQFDSYVVYSRTSKDKEPDPSNVPIHEIIGEPNDASYLIIIPLGKIVTGEPTGPEEPGSDG